ncbi:MAG TPA: DUF742 domain-containing protein [Acidimicrobiia bacterium]|jgi:hypothetical protein
MSAPHGPSTPPRLVRPYVVTRGRTASAGARVALEDAVESRQPPEQLDAMATPEARRIVALCVAPVSLAELAARLPLPVGAVRVLVGDLTDAGAVAVRESRSPDAATDVHLLKRLLDGIRAL